VKEFFIVGVESGVLGGTEVERFAWVWVEKGEREGSLYDLLKGWADKNHNSTDKREESSKKRSHQQAKTKGGSEEKKLKTPRKKNK